MSKTPRALLALSLLTLVVACAPKPEPVYVTEPVQPQPIHTGKYK